MILTRFIRIASYEYVGVIEYPTIERKISSIFGAIYYFIFIFLFIDNENLK